MGNPDRASRDSETDIVVNASDALPPRRMSGVAWVAIFIGITTLFVITYSQFKNAGKSNKLQLPEMGTVPDFAFTNQAGEPVTKESLLGTVWVANFIFTRCLGPCPMVTSRMLEIQQSLEKISDKKVKLLSFTVDPEYDTPAVLSEYSKNAHANPERWSFVTAGTDATTKDFVIKGMLQPLVDDPEGVPVHSTRFVIVDAKGHLRAFHDGSDSEVISKVLMDIGSLMREENSSAVREKIATTSKDSGRKAEENAVQTNRSMDND
ncbi:MAG: SCO family protein [Chthoniobacterales bacterium]